MVQITLNDIFTPYTDAKQKGIFRQKEVLSHSYIPPQTLHREKEFKTMANILGPALRGHSTSNCFLYGKTGTGKTMTAKQVSQELGKLNSRIKVLYVNCKMKGVTDTEYRLLAELSKGLGRQVPPTGLPTDEVYNIFFSALDSSGMHVMLVLDEIDSLVAKIGDGILYNLTRLNQSLQKSKLTIIGISNNISFMENMDPRVKSSLSEEEIIFPPYNSSQLADILYQRARLAFNEGSVQQGAVEKCAALAAQEHGDARKALDLLRIASELAERESSSVVRIDHVDMAESKLDSDKVIEITKSLPKQSLAVLAAAIQLADKGRKDIQTGDIFDAYEKICISIGLKVLTQRRFSDLIAELDMLGIISTKVVSKGRHGRTREIRIPLQDGMLLKVKSVLKECCII
ncbi:MAG: orc1/cdc6 family replication initiation protein [Candidatus Aenigmarchaeota archaeon]|nr:orc1/cdc6 family replication initiation protein [Candidatus Aenigmarchaeota archaeon]